MSDFVVCSSCGVMSHVSCAIDAWTLDEGNFYCLKCQVRNETMTKQQTITHLLSFYQDIEIEEMVFHPTDNHHEPFTEYYDSYKGRWTPSKEEVILGRVMRDLSTALAARTSTTTST